MPGPDEHLEALSNALLPDGVLGVFCPSVTQIGECLKKIKKLGLWLGKDMVVEFPPHAESVGAGLRGWNIKYTVVRARAKEAAAAAAELEEASVTAVDVGSSGEGAPEEEEEGREVLVCRPSVGDRLCGGGFFGMFRKKGEC